jgi:hypothetical protein
VSLGAGSAIAADAVKLQLGGWYHAAVGGIAAEHFSDTSGPNDGFARSHVVKQNVAVSFTGEGVLDNGIAVGAYIELRAQTQEDQMRKVYAYLSGGFGKLQIGDQDGALAAMCYTVPTASKIFGADSPAVYGFNFSNAGVAGYGATNGTCYGIDSYSTQLVYFSPDFDGFQFALSYTPDNSEDTTNTADGFGTRSDDDLGQNSENISLAGVFSREFNGVGVTLGGAHTWSLDKEGVPDDVDKARDSNAYLQVAYAGFTIGGAAEYRQNFFEDGADNLVYGAGVVYQPPSQPWAFGLGWTRGDYEEAFGANGTGPFDATHDDIALTTSYALGPGITLDGLVEYSLYDSDEPDGPDYRGLGIGVGTSIRF